MDENKIIVICGDPASGFVFHGPFDSESEAIEWAAIEMKGSWHIAPLWAPDAKGDTPNV